MRYFQRHISSTLTPSWSCCLSGGVYGSLPKRFIWRLGIIIFNRSFPWCYPSVFLLGNHLPDVFCLLYQKLMPNPLSSTCPWPEPTQQLHLCQLFVALLAHRKCDRTLFCFCSICTASTSRKILGPDFYFLSFSRAPRALWYLLTLESHYSLSTTRHSSRVIATDAGLPQTVLLPFRWVGWRGADSWGYALLIYYRNDTYCSYNLCGMYCCFLSQIHGASCLWRQ